MLKFKGNFGELFLNISDTKTTGNYQENGVLSGDFVNNTFKGNWKNKGDEGLIVFTILDGKLSGSWKKGLQAGPMHGKWEGVLVDESDNTSKNVDVIVKDIEDNGSLFEHLDNINPDKFYNELIANAKLIVEIVTGTNEDDEIVDYWDFEDAVLEAEDENVILNDHGLAYFFMDNTIYEVVVYIENNEGTGINKLSLEDIQLLIKQLIIGFDDDEDYFYQEHEWALNYKSNF
ncbi:hypothetical protein [Flavobacterium sp.]|uniref:hypothetical protein n=1 Tax=Flavobacterium sp. TaxID=239 RepID=UPI002487FC2C|nr:hypothetical protein [Flavobacterium sp.]MDI1317749.1 hypothetical protein [Flavobacterium sp.]